VAWWSLGPPGHVCAGDLAVTSNTITFLSKNVTQAANGPATEQRGDETSGGSLSLVPLPLSRSLQSSVRPPERSFRAARYGLVVSKEVRVWRAGWGVAFAGLIVVFTGLGTVGFIVMIVGFAIAAWSRTLV